MESKTLFNNEIFTVHDILYYYDWPRVFVIKNKVTNQFYLFTEVEAEEEYDAWIVVEIIPNHEEDITQYGLYHSTDRTVYLVTYDYIINKEKVDILSSDSEYLRNLSSEKMPINN